MPIPLTVYTVLCLYLVFDFDIVTRHLFIWDSVRLVNSLIKTTTNRISKTNELKITHGCRNTTLLQIFRTYLSSTCCNNTSSSRHYSNNNQLKSFIDFNLRVERENLYAGCWLLASPISRNECNENVFWHFFKIAEKEQRKNTQKFQ